MVDNTCNKFWPFYIFEVLSNFIGLQNLSVSVKFGLVFDSHIS